MKNAAVLFACTGLFFAQGAFAQTAPAKIDPPPPPGMNDPGVQPAADASSASAGKHMDIPDASDSQDGENDVQEYRRNGTVYKVVVTPKHGIPQTYMVDPDGTRHLQGKPPVQPVMYKVLEWGKPAPASSAG